MRKNSLHRDSSLAEWLDHIESVHPATIELGLDRVESVAEKLNLLSPTAKVVTVAGTNGKGSTITALSRLYASYQQSPPASRCVGCFTSPHILNFNERIVVDGEPVSDQELATAFTAIEDARSTTQLTYFEYSTLAALMIFKARNVDVMLLEVGLGGRLDAVNIIDADIAIITSIALDHQEWLGDTVDEIALEKAGILRNHQQVILADKNPPKALVDELQRRQKCTTEFRVAYYCGEGLPGNVESQNSKHATDPTANRFDQSVGHGWLSGDGSKKSHAWFIGFITDSQGKVACDLKARLERLPGIEEFGLHPASWSAAFAGYYFLEHETLFGQAPFVDNPAKVRSGISLSSLVSSTVLVGRMSEHAYRQRKFIVDVAHNPAAIERFSQILEEKYSVSADDPSIGDIVIFAALADKDVELMLGQLCSRFERVVVAGLPGNARAVPEERLSAMFESLANTGKIVFVAHDVDAAINWSVQETRANDKIFVVGSFFTVAAFLSLPGCELAGLM